jgi:hypothetical protein
MTPTEKAHVYPYTSGFHRYPIHLSLVANWTNLRSKEMRICLMDLDEEEALAEAWALVSEELRLPGLT